jgi:hypothetical protein
MSFYHTSQAANLVAKYTFCRTLTWHADKGIICNNMTLLMTHVVKAMQ